MTAPRCASTSTAPRSPPQPTPARSATSTNALQIGGDCLYGQYFKGLIDNVRIYNTALSAAQIQADQGTSVSSVLSAPGTLSANAVSPTEIDLSWGAATGGATSYLVERCAGANCGNFAQIGTSSTTTFKDTSVVANNSYSYRIRATDTGGDLGGYSNVATATTAFTVSPNNVVLTFTRTQQYTAQGPGGGSVTWRVDGVAGGSAGTGTITTSGVYTPPSTVGTHTISAAAGVTLASVTVYVSNDPGTFTYHNDNLRDGAEPERDGAHAGERQLDELREGVQLPARRFDLCVAAVCPERERAGAGVPQHRDRRDRARQRLRVRCRRKKQYADLEGLVHQSGRGRDADSAGGHGRDRGHPERDRDHRNAGDRSVDQHDLRRRGDQGSQRRHDDNTSTGCTRSTSRPAPRSSAARS